MNNPKSLVLLLFFFLMLFLFFPSDSLQNEDQQPHPSSSSSYYYYYYWVKKIKTLFNHAQSYLFPPNLDFRRSIRNDVTEEGGSSSSSKIKDAVTESLGKGTAAVEESAKSAAEKLKDTLSSSSNHHQPQDL